MEKPENKLFFNWIDHVKFKSELTRRVKKSKTIRVETQAELATTLEIPLTKIKQIENGSCKDFNAINNYLNYFSNSLIN